jgi:putative pyruvate formate lyase activating enzyme
MIPFYLELTDKEFDEKIEKAYELLRSCELCPRRCKVNRLAGERGYCQSTAELKVSSYSPHFGEEEELVGRYGSGTIFFTNCNLKCVYCQNYDISHLGKGRKITEEELAQQMLYLQEIGCHNINLVTPTHYSPNIIKAIKIAKSLGLKLPIVYNCSGYELVETLRLMEGIVDIYMPDAKYTSSEPAKKYSNAADYLQINKQALLEMHRQVGELKTDENGIAQRGLIIRHLVLPYDLAGTEALVKFIAKNLSLNTYINIMSQYRPMYRAYDFPMLSRSITYEEYKKAVDLAKQAGLTNIHIQLPLTLF